MPEDAASTRVVRDDLFDLLFIYTEEPVHCGVGQGLGAIDQPIQREVHTDFPVIYGSGIRGSLREALGPLNGDATKLFGSEPPGKGSTESGGTDDRRTYPGALSPHDARLVLFPVQALASGFAWITCPLALSVLWRNLLLADADPSADTTRAEHRWTVMDSIDSGKCLLTGSSTLAVDGAVVLRDHAFKPARPGDGTAQPTTDRLANWLSDCAFPTGDEYSYWRSSLAERLVVLSDSDFTFFVQTATEVNTRVRLENKVVATGALWVEEAIPPEALLFSPMAACTRHQRVSDTEERDVTASEALTAAHTLIGTLKRITLGGTESIGRGRVCLRWLKGGEQ